MPSLGALDRLSSEWARPWLQVHRLKWVRGRNRGSSNCKICWKMNSPAFHYVWIFYDTLYFESTGKAKSYKKWDPVTMRCRSSRMLWLKENHATKRRLKVILPLHYLCLHERTSNMFRVKLVRFKPTDTKCLFQWEAKLSEPWAMEHVSEVISRVAILTILFREWKLVLTRAN